MDIKKVLLIAGGALAIGFTFLYLQNKQHLNAQPLSKEQLERFLKILRKKKYRVYKYIATVALNYQHQMKGAPIDKQMIDRYVNSPQSPWKIKEEIQKRYEEALKQNGLSSEEFQLGLQQYGDQKSISFLIEQDLNDYNGSLIGKVPAFRVDIPEHLTKQKFYQLQNLITKKAFIKQGKLFRKFQQYTQAEIQQDPAILADIGDHQQEKEDLLKLQGLQGDFWPAIAVFEAANLKFRIDSDFRAQILKIQKFYENIFKKYATKIHNKSMSEAEFGDMEDQILFGSPQLF